MAAETAQKLVCMTETYDIAAQQRIRSALRAYAEAHSIGSVRLARRISETDPEGVTVPVVTLQRFMQGNQVREEALAALARFVDRENPQ